MSTIDGQISPIDTVNGTPSGDQYYDDFDGTDILNHSISGGTYRADYDTNKDGQINSYDASLLMRQRENRTPVPDSLTENSFVPTVTGTGAGTQPSLQELLEQQFKRLTDSAKTAGESVEPSNGLDKLSEWIGKGNNAFIAIAGFIFSLILITRLTK